MSPADASANPVAFLTARLLWAAVLALGVAFPLQAQTTVLWVTTPAPSGPGSLGAAIAALQASHPGWQEIRFSLSAGANTIALSAPLPPINGPRVRIDGADSGAGVIIEGNLHALFTVPAAASTVELEVRNLRLQRGGRIGRGGCLGVFRSETATHVQDVHFDRCRAYLGATTPARGGAVYSEGALTVLDSMFTENGIVNTVDAGDTADALGGALAMQSNRPLTVYGSLFQGNYIRLVNALPSFCASGHGGAIALAMSADAQAVVAESTFLGNITPCSNPAHPSEVPQAGDGGAIVLYGRGTYRIASNYFQANRGRRGGALMADQAHFSTLAIVNNTFHQNIASASGGGVAVINCCATTLDHNTFVANTGLSTSYGSQFAIIGSPISAIRYNAFSGSTPACTSGFITSAQNITLNAYSDGGCGFTGETGSLSNLGAMDFFGTPAWFGGATFTMRPAQGSVAIDAGPAGAPCPALYDARGVIRPLDGNGDGTSACDIGAHEASYIDLIFASGFQ